MTIALRSEYVGFTVDETSRIYTMRVRKPGGILHEFQIAIANQAFLTNRVRYQDAAEICFLKLERELSQCAEDTLPAPQDADHRRRARRVPRLAHQEATAAAPEISTGSQTR